MSCVLDNKHPVRASQPPRTSEAVERDAHRTGTELLSFGLLTIQVEANLQHDPRVLRGT